MKPIHIRHSLLCMLMTTAMLAGCAGWPCADRQPLPTKIFGKLEAGEH